MGNKSGMTQNDIIVGMILKYGQVYVDQVIKMIKKYKPDCVMDKSLVHARVVKINETKKYLNMIGSALVTYKVRTENGFRTVIIPIEYLFTSDVPPFTRGRTTKNYKIKKMKV
jgi:hypothetical protein